MTGCQKRAPSRPNLLGCVGSTECVGSGSGQRAWHRTSVTHWGLKMRNWDQHTIFGGFQTGLLSASKADFGPPLFKVPSAFLKPSCRSLCPRPETTARSHGPCPLAPNTLSRVPLLPRGAWGGLRWQRCTASPPFPSTQLEMGRPPRHPPHGELLCMQRVAQSCHFCLPNTFLAFSIFSIPIQNIRCPSSPTAYRIKWRLLVGEQGPSWSAFPVGVFTPCHACLGTPHAPTKHPVPGALLRSASLCRLSLLLEHHLMPSLLDQLQWTSSSAQVSFIAGYLPFSPPSESKSNTPEPTLCPLARVSARHDPVCPAFYFLLFLSVSCRNTLQGRDDAQAGPSHTAWGQHAL